MSEEEEADLTADHQGDRPHLREDRRDLSCAVAAVSEWAR